MRVVVFREKHESRMFLLPSLHEEIILQRILFKIFNERREEGCWYFEDEMEKRELKLYRNAEKGDIVPFMQYRSNQGAEYETFEIIEPEKWDEI